MPKYVASLALAGTDLACSGASDAPTALRGCNGVIAAAQAPQRGSTTARIALRADRHEQDGRESRSATFS
jgi:hypothetical protein